MLQFLWYYMVAVSIILGVYLGIRVCKYFC